MYPRLTRSLRAIAMTSSVLTLTGCLNTASTVRLGDPQPIPGGGPRSVCEEADWYQLVPTRSFEAASESGGGWTTTVQERVTGYSVYRYGSLQPEDLRVVLPRMGESELERQQLSRIESILSRQERSARLMQWGGYLTGAAVVLTVAGSPEVGIYPSLAGLGLVLWGFVTDPGADETAYALPRQFTVSGSEGDVEALRRGVARLNRQTRQRCSDGAPPSRQAPGPDVGPLRSTLSPFPRSVR